jgi:tetratricopeptide (TPR) repeat protein
MKIKLWSVVMPALAFGMGVLVSSLMSGMLITPPPPPPLPPPKPVVDASSSDHNADASAAHAQSVALPASFIDPRSKAMFYDGLGVLAAKEYLKGNAPADSAMQHLLDAVTADQDYAHAWLHLGLIQAMERDSDRALQLFHKVLDLEPNNFRAQLHIALQHEARGELDLAKGMYHKIYVDRLPETHIAQYFHDVESPWLNEDVKGKQLDTKDFRTKMNNAIIDVLVIHEFEPNPYQHRTSDKDFKTKEMAVLKGLLQPIMLARVQKYLTWIESIGAHSKDGQRTEGGHPAATRKTALNERMARLLYGIVSPYISNVLGRPVKPSYSFMGIYTDQTDLFAHRDNDQCEYTVSIEVDVQPKGYKWPIHVCNEHKAGGDWKEKCGGSETALESTPGDAVMFRGRFRTHRREKLAAGAKVSQIFLHFVNIDYRGGLMPGDKASAGVPTE